MSKPVMYMSRRALIVNFNPLEEPLPERVSRSYSTTCGADGKGLSCFFRESPVSEEKINGDSAIYKMTYNLVGDVVGDIVGY